MTRYELAVIGAGPAGLAAALAAADRGVRIVLIDEATDAGGQFYRQTARQLRARRPERLYHAWSTWEKLRDRLAAHRDSGRITFLTERQVWHVEASPDGFIVHALVGPDQKASETQTADGLVLATGGYERVLPFPGWTLPGVLTAGGAQAMLKAGLVLPGRRVVVAGAGPLLLPVAAGLAAGGAEVAGLYDSSDPRAFTQHVRALSRNPGKLIEGAGYAAHLARHGVRLRFRLSVIAAHGSDRLEAVTIARPDGRERRIPCDTLAVSHGLLPHTEIAQALGARLSEKGFVAVDSEQRTDIPNLWAAGETTGIGGAALSLVEGEIAGRSAAARLRRGRTAAEGFRGAAAAERAAGGGDGESDNRGDGSSSDSSGESCSSSASRTREGRSGGSCTAAAADDDIGSGMAAEPDGGGNDGDSGDREDGGSSDSGERRSRGGSGTREGRSGSGCTAAATDDGIGSGVTAEPDGGRGNGDSGAREDGGGSAVAADGFGGSGSADRRAGASTASPTAAASPAVIPGVLEKVRRRLGEFAGVLESAYSVPDGWASRVDGETVLCRCEEVTAAAVREAVDELGATDLRTIKLLTRAGMGWCQGRICGPGVAGVAGCALVPAGSPFARPVPLGVLAETSREGESTS